MPFNAGPIGIAVSNAFDHAIDIAADLVDGKHTVVGVKDKIAQASTIIESYGAKTQIQVDGGVSSKNILELTKKVGTPVYLIEMSSCYKKEVYIQSEIPNLGELGVASFYPAEQLYQDLAYFIGNTMKDSPDTAGPVVIDDLTRLQQYGFDKKVSFRHRK